MRKLALIFMLSLPLPLLAQEAPTTDESDRDRSWLTGMIEDNLSGAGRTVRLDGFQGALSSRATFDQLTISDDQGVWLTIRNGAMQWSRSALLTGRIEIGELSAAEIDLPRLPVTPPDEDAAAPEVTPFALPDLPVSVNVGKLTAQKVMLGAPLLGEEVAFDLDGSLSLSGGTGKTVMKVNRIGGPKGQFSFNAGFANDTRQLSLDLLVDEAAGGIVAKKVGLPGEPALTLAVAGSGPLDNFNSDIVLSTDGQPRLSGKVILGSHTPEGATAADSTFDANLAGDITPMLPEEYRAFFGNHVAFVLTGAQKPDGMLNLTKLGVTADAFTLDGQLDLLASGMPSRFDLTAKLGLASGTPVLLPVSGEPMRVQDGTIALSYDQSQSARWTLDGVVNGLDRSDVKIAALTLAGGGTITPTGTPAADGQVTFTADGLALADPALAEAVGARLRGSTGFAWTENQPLKLSGLDLSAKDLTLAGDIGIDNLSNGVDVTADLRLDAQRLANFARVAGMPLAGAARGTVTGTATLLTGAFDLTADIAGQDLKIGQQQVDNLLAGASKITASARRDEKGLTLRSLTANARNLTAEAQGLLATGTTDLNAKIAMPDLAVLGGGYRGAVNLTATVKDQNGERRYAANGTAHGVAIGNEQLDRLLAGNTTLSAEAADAGKGILLRALKLNNPQLQVTAEGDPSRMNVSARLANAALLEPNLPGPVTVTGTLGQTGNSYRLDLRGTAPGETQATVTGTIAADMSASDLTIRGNTQMALANAFITPQSVEGPLSFDLRMNGRPGLAALSGRISAAGGRITVPGAGLALEGLDLRADLAQSRMQLTASGNVKGGGSLRLSGPVALTAPYNADLRIDLNGMRLRDPQLYDTRISGGLTIAGPMTGGAMIRGALTLDETEIRVPSGGLGGAAAIPEMRHLAEGAASRSTRARAGLLGEENGKENGGGGAGFGLDITVAAPHSLFVRGRGLDAELGGQIRLTGTTSHIVPIGNFSLIRGRLSVLAKRFDLTDGTITMQGAMVPWISFTATTNTADTAIALKLEGDATEPALTITSSPELPEEEVLARLLFDKGLTNLSALQAAQLASSVAALAGKGGDGIMGRLRQNFGLDDFDVGTDAQGNATVKAGKYISEKAYTDVTLDGRGETTLNLNLDVTRAITARGSVGSDGNSSVGLFFEKDY
ncbi:translocation/assembly module TamB domain-containing protein [Paenirhodobacter sp.]|uniref:translocation/assembly module TamB domain-containing protein n=1 Tax=Paenirhodobacter sp. TaxID=1965326 RepID=UPI003B40A080